MALVSYDLSWSDEKDTDNKTYVRVRFFTIVNGVNDTLLEARNINYLSKFPLLQVISRLNDELLNYGTPISEQTNTPFFLTESDDILLLEDGSFFLPQ